ncbi:MAG: hypothetical protein KY453_10280, partial [Gemmatimonadetes bacterium]|nr:hypothetical protein [Gemmatimonadota bacterium]
MTAPAERRATFPWGLVVWAVSLLYFGSLFDRRWIPLDEGTLGQSALRVLRGEWPHRDFDAVYSGLLELLHLPLGIDLDPESVDLPEVGHVRVVVGVDPVDGTTLGDLRLAPQALFGEELAELPELELVDAALDRLRVVVADVGEE